MTTDGGTEGRRDEEDILLFGIRMGEATAARRGAALLPYLWTLDAAPADRFKNVLAYGASNLLARSKKGFRRVTRGHRIVRSTVRPFGAPRTDGRTDD